VSEKLEQFSFQYFRDLTRKILKKICGNYFEKSSLIKLPCKTFLTILQKLKNEEKVATKKKWKTRTEKVKILLVKNYKN
jgi:hypothetical protein